MQYMLITGKGKVYIFRIYDLGLTYQRAYGGILSVVPKQQKTVQTGQVFENCLPNPRNPV